MDDILNGFSELLAEVKAVMRDEQGVAEEKQVWISEPLLSFLHHCPLASILHKNFTHKIVAAYLES